MKLQYAYQSSLQHCIIIAQHCAHMLMAMSYLLWQYSQSNASGEITLKSNTNLPDSLYNADIINGVT